MAQRHSLIWGISHPDTEHRSYLMGTMHVGDEKAYKVAHQAVDLISATHLFLSEVDLHELMGGGMTLSLPPERSLEDLLGRSYAKYRGIASKAFGLDLDNVISILPLVVVNLISEMVLSKDYPVSLDQHLWQSAIAQGKKTGGLETIEEHAATLEAISIEDQVSMLKSALRNVKKFRHKIIRLSELYSEGRIHELYTLSKQGLGRHKDVLLYHRNQLMTDRWAEAHSQQPIFAAVGAAHLSGAKGMLHLLSRRGYQLTAL